MHMPTSKHNDVSHSLCVSTLCLAQGLHLALQDIAVDAYNLDELVATVLVVVQLKLKAAVQTKLSGGAA